MTTIEQLKKTIQDLQKVVEKLELEDQRRSIIGKRFVVKYNGDVTFSIEESGDPDTVFIKNEKTGHCESFSFLGMIASVKSGVYQYVDTPNTGRPEQEKTPNTVIGWLDTISDPLIRERALNNYDSQRVKKGENYYSLKDAIFGAFVWSDSPEGYDYWDKFYESL